MKTGNNVNVNSFQELKNVNVNDTRTMNAIRNAVILGDRFGDGEKSWRFYLKVAWRLTPAEIWGNAEIAEAKSRTTPAKYFAFLCRLTGKLT